ncbi:MAG: COQ9 family protein [Litorimonas sp.]
MSQPNDTRDAILKAALKIAPFEGWTNLTLKRAVRDAGYPDGSGELYFENGIADLLDHWSDKLNTQTAQDIGQLDLDALKIRERVTQGVLLRLQAIGPHEEAARRASSRLILPDLASTGMRQIWSAADTIWRAIGDTSTDANYYSKRAILSSVIGSTLPIWLSDQSDDKAKARAFLDARIENVMEFEKFKWRVKDLTKTWPEPAEILGQLRYGGLDFFSRPKKGRARRRRYSR